MFSCLFESKGWLSMLIIFSVLYQNFTYFFFITVLNVSPQKSGIVLDKLISWYLGFFVVENISYFEYIFQLIVLEQRSVTDLKSKLLTYYTHTQKYTDFVSSLRNYHTVNPPMLVTVLVRKQSNTSPQNLPYALSLPLPSSHKVPLFLASDHTESFASSLMLSGVWGKFVVSNFYKVKDFLSALN